MPEGEGWKERTAENDAVQNYNGDYVCTVAWSLIKLNVNFSTT